MFLENLGTLSKFELSGAKNDRIWWGVDMPHACPYNDYERSKSPANNTLQHDRRHALLRTVERYGYCEVADVIILRGAMFKKDKISYPILQNILCTMDTPSGCNQVDDKCLCESNWAMKKPFFNIPLYSLVNRDSYSGLLNPQSSYLTG